MKFTEDLIITIY